MPARYEFLAVQAFQAGELSEWAEASQMSMGELKSVLEAMRTGASYVPGRRDPRFEWWLEVMQEEV